MLDRHRDLRVFLLFQSLKCRLVPVELEEIFDMLVDPVITLIICIHFEYYSKDERRKI
jgi:hypothetical protein